MKFGMRRPSLMRSVKARTTGRAKRAVKKALIPGYGRKGMGWIRNPKKAAYNKVYRKATFLCKAEPFSKSERTSGLSFP